MKLRCRVCGTYTSRELLFCTRCRLSLTPRTRYDLLSDDYVYPPDQDSLELLESTGPLPYLIKNLFVGKLQETIEELISTTVEAEYAPRIEKAARLCADTLCLRRLPEVLIRPSKSLNAFTFGTDDSATIVVHSAALKALTDEEIQVLISHEMAHVKSRHLLYHTLAEYLASGATFSASVFGLGIISVPIRLALLSWHRESEVTADRASLLVVNDLKVFRSLMTKLMVFSDISKNQADLDREIDLVESMSELLQTHPLYGNRVKLAAEFFRSVRFMQTRQKILQREKLSRALVPECLFCEAAKPVDALFCPLCGKCQI